MISGGVGCPSCGSDPAPAAKFCAECGARIASAAPTAEYKQVTVLFADVVHSMDIAAAVGPERLREIMADLIDRTAAVVRRYHGTVDKFTGDGVMAVFGAPIALEDHALRACLTALDIQGAAAELTADVKNSDRVELQLRIGLNSGQVIAGEIGSSKATYTAIGEQVGMAQRMESAAAPGAVMVSESTARLVGNAVILGEPERVHIKGSDNPVSARRLLAISDQQPTRRNEAALVGRTWELATVKAVLEEAIEGAGCVLTLAGPPGIGKSRLVRETVASASERGVPVFSTYCESHTTDVAFNVVARLLRATTGIEGLGADEARARVRARLPQSDPEDLLLIDDLLGIGDPEVPTPDIGPDARRRRLTAVVNAAAISARTPAVYVIEDAHWIDAASESMLADFMAVAPQTPSLMLLTYRPEYRGELSRVPGAQTIALRPLSDAHSTALTTALVGADPSLAALVDRVVDRAAGNPFFAEEMVRDLAERGVMAGQPGAYALLGDVDDVDVPANLQATIGARIDRLPGTAKKTLNAASVIGLRFSSDLLSDLIDDADVAPLIAAEVVDQATFTDPPEYAFRHPLIRAVAYESQLKSDRAQLHRRLGAAIEAWGSEENASLIAQHLEAAGDLRKAFDWHMRAATWSTFRNFAAAHASWLRARQVADRLPEDDPDRLLMRIAARTLLCANEYRIRSGRADVDFSELRELCAVAADQRSLAIGLAGLALATQLDVGTRESSRLATDLVSLVKSIGDPALIVGLSVAYLNVILAGGKFAEVIQLANRVIELTDGRPAGVDLISVSPLANAMAIRGAARWCLGSPGWRDDFDRALEAIATVPPAFRSGTFWIVYLMGMPNGVLLPGPEAIAEINEIASSAEQFGEEITVELARAARESLLPIARVPNAKLESGCSKRYMTPPDGSASRSQTTSH